MTKLIALAALLLTTSTAFAASPIRVRPHLCGQDECQPRTIASGQNSPDSLALVGSSVYWATVDGVATVAKAGGSVTVLASAQTGMTGIVASGNAIYWTAIGAEEFQTTLDGSVCRVRAAGGPVACLPATTADPFGASSGPNGIAWADFTLGTVSTAEIGLIETLAAGENGPMATAQDADGVAWIAYNSREIRLSTNGGPPVTIAVDPQAHGSAPYTLVMTPALIYWSSNNVPGEPGFLRSVTRAAPHVVTELATDPTGSMVGFAIDATHAYVVAEDVDSSRILRIPLAGGPAVRLATTPEAFAIAVDATTVYWTLPGDSTGNGEVVAMSKTAP